MHNSNDKGTAPKRSGSSKVKSTFLLILLFLVFSIGYTCIKEQKESSKMAAAGDGSSSHDDDAPHRELDEEFYPYYAGLSDLGKTVYEDVLAGIEAGEEKVTLSKEQQFLNTAFFSSLAAKIAYDQPQLFWYDGEFECIYDESSKKVVAVLPKYNNLVLDLENNRNAIDSVADALLRETENLTDLEAEKYFFDYLCRNITYTQGEYDQNIYSAFVEKATVCSGYAHALQYLMMKRGVPCYYATGFAYDIQEEEMMRHAWNIIKLNGEFYNCDPTFGDFYNEENKYPSYISYDIYNVSDDQIQDAQHSRDQFGMALPACTAQDLDYNALYGREWEYDAVEQINTDCTYVIHSKDEYLKLLYDWLTTHGSGTHNFTFIMKSDALDQLFAISESEYTDSVFYPAVDYLGINGQWRANWNFTWWGLAGEEYCYVEQYLELY